MRPFQSKCRAIQKADPVVRLNREDALFERDRLLLFLGKQALPAQVVELRIGGNTVLTQDAGIEDVARTRQDQHRYSGKRYMRDMRLSACVRVRTLTMN